MAAAVGSLMIRRTLVKITALCIEDGVLWVARHLILGGVTGRTKVLLSCPDRWQ